MQYLKGRVIPLVEEDIMMILAFFNSGKDPLLFHVSSKDFNKFKSLLMYEQTCEENQKN